MGQGMTTSARPGKITYGRARPRGLPPAWSPSAQSRALFELDRGASLLEFPFDLFGFVALDALFDRFRGLVDDRLGLFQAEAGRGPNDLDHRHFLATDLGQHHVDRGG